MEQQGASSSQHNSDLLMVSAGTESPGSSVFDLPIQPVAPNPTGVLRPAFQLSSIQDNELSFVIISGGTGGNAICSAFGNACYVLPVSDDGGSSSEIIRVLGGPSVGDIRSRLVRLIPSTSSSLPLEAIRCFLSYRLPAKCEEKEARDEWRDIVEGRSPLWNGIPYDRKETIRGFLVYFESELLRRAHKNFDFRNGSIGNYLLAAAQKFFRSLPSAIFLFSSITNSQATILPVIVTNHTVTIAAELENGIRLVGQCEISHPVPQGVTADAVLDEPLFSIEGLRERIVHRKNVMFEQEDKSQYESLVAPIAKLFYINAYGMEIHPTPNPDYLANLNEKEVLIYSCGSLWTSIVPCLALRGVAVQIARSSKLRAKILLLNVENDRETERYTAVDYILSALTFTTVPDHADTASDSMITKTLNTNYETVPYGLGNASTTCPVSAFVTHLIYLEGANVPVDVMRITALGVKCTRIDSREGCEDGEMPRYNPTNVQKAVNQILRDLKGR